jgi:Carboxypeptidase regulatory-like domain
MRSSSAVVTRAVASAFAIGVLITCCVIFATGCGASPTAPDEAGTFLRFTVTDRVDRPLAGALVAVLDGPHAGTTKLTDDAGRFELTGTAVGTVTIRASRDGFQTRTQALSWDPRPFYSDRFWLDTVEPSIGLDPGDYTLTIAIDLATASDPRGMPQAPCAGFPVDLASRRYRATIVEDSSPTARSNRYVRLDDRAFFSIFFSVSGPFVGFEIEEGIAEDLPGFGFLTIGGAAPTTEPAIATGSSVSIPFYGEFRHCQLTFARVGYYNDCSQVPAAQIVDYHSCTSDHATMVFTKR